jgi:hypothetical protein
VGPWTDWDWYNAVSGLTCLSLPVFGASERTLLYRLVGTSVHGAGSGMEGGKELLGVYLRGLGPLNCRWDTMDGEER